MFLDLKSMKNLREINNNIIHSLCVSALKNNIIINNGSIQRTFVPSQIFIQVLNFIITKKIF